MTLGENASISMTKEKCWAQAEEIHTWNARHQFEWTQDSNGPKSSQIKITTGIVSKQCYKPRGGEIRKEIHKRMPQTTSVICYTCYTQDGMVLTNTHIANISQ